MSFVGYSLAQESRLVYALTGHPPDVRADIHKFMADVLRAKGRFSETDFSAALAVALDRYGAQR